MAQAIVERKKAETAGQCPECSGTVSSGKERVCADCGLVVEEDQIDHGPEWRGVGEEWTERARTGPPASVRKHDKKLQTQIGRLDRDGYGNQLSPSQREKADRIRRVSKWGTTANPQEETLKKTLAEVNRMACALGLPDHVVETASVLVRRSLEEGLFPGRCIEAMASAALFIGGRQHSNPRSASDIESVARVEEKRILRCYRYVASELELAIKPVNPSAYLSQFASELEVSQGTRRLAAEAIQTAKEQRSDGLSGRNPVGIVAGALYFADREVNGVNSRTQDEIAAVTNVTANTIRESYRILGAEYKQSGEESDQKRGMR